MLPVAHLPAILQIFGDIEELEDEQVRPIDYNNNKASFRFMSDIEYGRMKANYVLTTDK